MKTKNHFQSLKGYRKFLITVGVLAFTGIAFATTIGGTSIITEILELAINADGSTTNGDIWYNGTNFLGYSNGAQVQLDNEDGDGATSQVFNHGSAMNSFSQNGSHVPGISVATTNFNLNTHTFFIPAELFSTAKIIQSAKMYVNNPTGSYDGDVTLEMKIFGVDNNEISTATSSPVNIEDFADATPNSWQNIDLTEVVGDRTIAAGDVAAFVFSVSGGDGGDFSSQFYFEVTLEDA